MFWRKGCKIVPIVFPKKDKFLHKTCSICLEDLNNNYVTLPCSHNYHEDCIMTWFGKQNRYISCPQCRMNFHYTLVKGDDYINQ